MIILNKYKYLHSKKGFALWLLIFTLVLLITRGGENTSPYLPPASGFPDKASEFLGSL